ncbi:hypothetical protein ACGRHY_29195 [Streptomyces sp. HK10]|uniref:hypothetical protein n=1 Tax=Streptomyces sp. HK10 TaxID=3373255 RepID=UPI00374A0053
MTIALAEMTGLPVEVMEFDRIECAECKKVSPFLDDGDDGTHDAHDAGWHVLNVDECGCPNLCGDCAEELCGVTDDSPRLFGMRIV